MRIPLTTSEGLTILGLIVGGTVAWTTLSGKVQAMEKVVDGVPAVITRVAILESKIDYLTDLLEYSTGLRDKRPRRPR